MFDYRKVTPETDPELFAWRKKFNAACDAHGIKPAVACVQFRCVCVYVRACVCVCVCVENVWKNGREDESV